MGWQTPLTACNPPPVNEDFAHDIRTIEAIKAVPAILEIVCQATGMGFAAVARVTDDR